MALSCCLLAGARAAASPSAPSSATLLRRRHCPLAVAVGPLPHAQRLRRGLRLCCASTSSSSPPPPPVPPEEPGDYEVRALCSPLWSGFPLHSSSFIMHRVPPGLLSFPLISKLPVDRDLGVLAYEFWSIVFVLLACVLCCDYSVPASLMQSLMSFRFTKISATGNNREL